MKNKYGKIGIGLLVALCVVMLVVVLVNHARAAETYANQFMFRTTYTYPEVVFVEFPTGNVADATTGVPTTAETWEDNDITATQHAQSDFWTVTTPPLASNKSWVMCICDAASADGAVETDTMMSYFYNPITNTTTDSDLSSSGAGIYTRPAPTQ